MTLESKEVMIFYGILVSAFTLGSTLMWWKNRIKQNTEGVKAHDEFLFDKKRNPQVPTTEVCEKERKECQDRVCHKLQEISKKQHEMEEKREKAILTAEARYTETIRRFENIDGKILAIHGQLHVVDERMGNLDRTLDVIVDMVKKVEKNTNGKGSQTQ